jgi:hypothetical protein
MANVRSRRTRRHWGHRPLLLLGASRSEIQTQNGPHPALSNSLQSARRRGPPVTCPVTLCRAFPVIEFVLACQEPDPVSKSVRGGRASSALPPTGQPTEQPLPLSPERAFPA